MQIRFWPRMTLELQTMSAGMGGGVALVIHAILIALMMAAAFTAALVLGGPSLDHAMGGSGPALDAAIAYSNILLSRTGSSTRRAASCAAPATWRCPPRS
jgi:hypothetical protein